MPYVKQIQVDTYAEFLEMTRNEKFTISEAIVNIVLNNLKTRKKEIPIFEVEVSEEDVIYTLSIQRKEFLDSLDFVLKNPRDGNAEGGRIGLNTGTNPDTFVSGIEAILNLPDLGSDIRPKRRPDIEMDEEDEVDPFSERRERLGDRFVSSRDTMKIESFLSTLDKETQEAYGPQLGDYIEEGKGSNSFFDAILESGFSQGGKVPGLPPGKQVDAREGTFIPMGGAKRADDVPAMLSVNEFVLNDNAVAGLGKMLTGTPDPRAGARALYKIQDQLEAMVV